MFSFHLTAVGRLSADPTTGPKGDVHFALIGEDYAGKGAEVVTTTVYFVAFGILGETLARQSKKGDQLILDAQMRANNYTKDGKTVYAHTFVVQGFRFGSPGRAKREALAASGA